jgi:hypothetical protein
LIIVVNFRLGARFLERLPASFPNLQSLTLQRCVMVDMENQTLIETALLEKIVAENPGLKIQVC